MGLMGLMGHIGLMSLIGPICIRGREVELPRGVSASRTACRAIGFAKAGARLLRHADEVEKETGPEIEHAAPGVANFAVADGGQETGADVVIDLIF